MAFNSNINFGKVNPSQMTHTSSQRYNPGGQQGMPSNSPQGMPFGMQSLFNNIRQRFGQQGQNQGQGNMMMPQPEQMNIPMPNMPRIIQGPGGFQPPAFSPDNKLSSPQGQIGGVGGMMPSLMGQMGQGQFRSPMPFGQRIIGEREQPDNMPQPFDPQSNPWQNPGIGGNMNRATTIANPDSVAMQMAYGNRGSAMPSLGSAFGQMFR